MNGAERISAERKRQIEIEGWSPDHDFATWHHGQLVHAAVCYALTIPYRDLRIGTEQQKLFDRFWPWDRRHWKPKPENRIRELEKAGALIAAEIDRILLAQDRRDEVINTDIQKLESALEKVEAALGEWSSVEVPYVPEWAMPLKHAQEELQELIHDEEGPVC